jgi:hypothetical protein
VAAFDLRLEAAALAVAGAIAVAVAKWRRGMELAADAD